MSEQQQLSANEGIKARSRHLRGTIEEGLADQVTGALCADDTQLTKFHGFYQQDDRDIRSERKKQKLEPLHSFMLRARIPGGVIQPKQWLAVDRIANELTNYGSIRLTTRQTFQYHGILKPNVKPLIQRLNDDLMDSIAACGDVNRNVLSNTNPLESELHKEVHEHAVKISEHLLPSTRAYHELWLDEKKVATSEEKEPIYGDTYLPRKFKIALAIPPHNDVDLYANDMGLVAISENGKLVGFNILAGGGMGTTHGDNKTYPQIARSLGFIVPEDANAVAEAIVTAQRDHGDRVNRKHARLKYTIDDMGLDTFRAEVEKRSGVTFQKERPFAFTMHSDRYGWVEGIEGNWNLTLFIEHGRIIDKGDKRLMTGLREIAAIHQGEFRMTATQNLIIANVPDSAKKQIESLAREYGLLREPESQLRLNSMACVALPTCALAMAEAERYLPDFVTKAETLLEKHGLSEQPIVIRMTGCPNGCARPFLAEIAFVGKAPGKYNFYLGGNGIGTRLNKMHKENVGEDVILADLDTHFASYAKDRQPDERFGDYVIRAGIIKATTEGRDFHD